MPVEDERPARPPCPPRDRDRLAPWAGLATLVTMGVGVFVWFRPQSDPPTAGPPLAGLLATAAAIVVWITAGALGIRGAVLAGLGRQHGLQVFRGFSLGPRGAVWVPIAIFCCGLALRELGGLQFGLSVETSKAESHQQTVFRPLAPSGDETVTTSQPPAVEIDQAAGHPRPAH